MVTLMRLCQFGAVRARCAGAKASAAAGRSLQETVPAPWVNLNWNARVTCRTTPHRGESIEIGKVLDKMPCF